VRRGQGIRHLAALVASAAALAALAGCGEERTFTASEFVDQVNEKGVSLRLGRQLQTSGDAESLNAVTLPGASGSLYVYADSGGASDQLEACRASAGLICFRAANVVVVLDEESGALGAQRLGVAIKGLE
jgi:hypothetical protein